jgi:dolichol-phosphate mannosyltransferase
VPARLRPSPATAARAGLLALAAGRFARGARRASAIAPDARPVDPAQVTALVPARDEARRIRRCVDSLVSQGVPVLVVDDGSTDRTAEEAAAAGARVLDAGALPAGWAGKAHALHVGLEAVETPVVVAMDADCRALPGAVQAAAGALDGRTMMSAGARVHATDRGGRLVHASMLATLVYRFGPPGVDARRPDRTMANGQLTVFDRRAFLDAGGFRPVAGSLVEDVAVARHLASRGHGVAFLDGTRLVTVEGYGSAVRTLQGWGRSLSLREVTPLPHLLADLAVVWSAMALPVPRLLAGRGDAVDLVALALRFAVVAATAPAFIRPGPDLALAPLADPLVAARLTAAAVAPSRRWKGRRYEAAARRS